MCSKTLPVEQAHDEVEQGRVPWLLASPFLDCVIPAGDRPLIEAERSWDLRGSPEGSRFLYRNPRTRNDCGVGEHGTHPN